MHSISKLFAFALFAAGTVATSGIDVYGSISGFFAQPTPRETCPCDRSSGYVNPN